MYAIYKDNFGDSLTDVADKIALVAQNIDESDPSKIKSITENAIGLSDAFGSDFEENLRGVNGLMTNMGLTADEAFDFIAKGSQNGLDKTHELTDNLAEYSQIWSQAGFSAEEMFSILQNGLDSGAYNLDKVNDFVKEFAISLSDGRIAENISSFSNESKNLFEEWKSGKATQADVFQSIISDLSNMTNQQEALTLASTVWSSLGEDNAMSVLTSLNKVNDKYTDVAGTMQEINDIQYNDAGSQIEALGRQFEVDILQPIVEKATPKIKEFITWLSDHLPEVTSALAGLITSVVTFKTATAAGNFLSSIINGFKQLTPAINAATTAQQTNNTVTAANPYVAVASAILGIVAATATWINTNYKAVDAIGDVNKLTEELEKNAAQQRQTVDIEIEQINSLNTVYDELRNKTSLTADEKSTLASVSEELAGKLGIEESNLKGVDGKYKDLTKSIDDYIKKAHQRVELSIIESSWEDVGKELESTKQELKKFLQDKGYSEGDLILDHSDAATAHQYQEKINLFEEKIKEYKNQYDALLRDSQETQETMTVSEALNAKNSSDATDKATNSIKNKTTATQQSTKSTQEETEAVEELTKTMSELTSKTTAVTNAESEYKETGKLTVSTLQTIIDKYPDLENEVYKYMLNLEDAKTLIKSMKNTYQDDLTSYISVITQKAGKSNTFYNELINANASFVNAAKEQYGIDLINFKNLQEAKQAMIAVEKSKIDKGWGNSTSWSDKFDLAGNLSKFNDVMNKYGDANTYLANQAVERFINNSLSATTNYLNLFDKTTDKIKKTANEGKKATDKASKAEDTLLKKYELVEAAYNRLVDKRIERIQKEQEAKEKAKNAAIAAIDAEVEARKRLNEDKESQNELDTINVRLKYEKLDELSRRELMRRKQELLNERAETKWQRMMSDKKDKLQSSYDSYKNNSDSMIDALQRAANSAADYFDTLKNGYKTNSYIVNNNSDTRNIQIIQNALSNQQMVDKLLKAIYSK